MSSNKEGPDSDFQKHLADVCSFAIDVYLESESYAQAEVLITTPFHPGYLTRDLVEKVFYTLSLGGLSTDSLQAKNLKICITAGVGSDHIDLNAAVDHKIQVLEVRIR